MKYVIYKAYWDFEKEEKWLNEMSSKGMALIDYSWIRYVFLEADRNKYTYRIELLEHFPKHAESIAYIRFLEESGIECVATYMRWIFLRKKTSEGPFDIYTDIDSKIKHYQRVSTLWNSVMSVEFLAGFSNIIVGAMGLVETGYQGLNSVDNILAGGGVSVLGLVFLRIGSQIRSKIKKLKQEKAIRE